MKSSRRQWSGTRLRADQPPARPKLRMGATAPIASMGAILAAAILLAAAPCQSQAISLPDPRGVDPASPNPLAGQSFFVDHGEPSWRQWRRYRRRGNRRRASLMWRVAREPKF